MKIDAKDLWILEQQILPNLYGLKYCALKRVIDAAKAREEQAEALRLYR